jgi:hypothetical protein
MAALVDNGHHRSTTGGRVQRAIPATGLAFRNSVDAARGFHRLLLERESDVPVVLTADLKEGLRHGG